MRAPSNLARGGLGFNMTPMIDVAFLLIVFFLVSSHLAQQEVQLELDLPGAESGRRAVDDETRRVVVNVLNDGQIMTAGRVVDQAELNRIIQFENSREEELEVRIRADRKVAYEYVEPIMVACAKSGVWKVTFSVIHREPGAG